MIEVEQDEAGFFPASSEPISSYHISTLAPSMVAARERMARQ